MPAPHARAVAALAALSVFVLSSPARSSPCQELTPPARRTCVVDPLGDARVAESLRRAGMLRSDAGALLVAELSDGARAWLGRRGASVVELPALEAGEALYFVAGADAERLAAAGARALVARGGLTLVAVRPVAAQSLRAPGRFHGGLALVPTRAMRPARAMPSARGGALPTLALGVADPRVQATVDQVDRARLQAGVVALSAQSRCASSHGADVARDWIVQQLASLGYSPTLQSFSGTYSENVIAELPGLSSPDEIVVVGAHYDSMASSCSAAPGADDNASGTAGVLEAARVLAAGGPYERTLRFVLFSAEEYGLVGSDFAASQSAAAGEDIVAMLNTDMSAYRAPGDAREVAFVTNNSSPELRALCDQLGALYVPGWASSAGPLSAGTSDHQSYHAQGYPAVFYFEDLQQYSPYIHSAGDTHPQSTNDFELSEMIVKGLVAAAASLADPLDLEIEHDPLPDSQQLGPYPVVCRVTSLTGANVTGVELFHRVAGGAWSSVAMSPQGADWAAMLPGAGSPVTHEYWLRAFDDQGGVESLPEGADAGAAPFAFFVGVRTVLYFDDFEGAGDGGWTHGQSATQDDWQRGPVFGKSGDPGAAFSGQNVWGNDLGPSGWNGAYAANVSNWLRSPSFDLSGAPNVHLRYRRWLTVEDSVYDRAELRVDGVTVWQNASGAHTLDAGWTLHALDLSAQAAGDPAVTIEFRLQSDGGLEFGGWNLDDFELVRLDPVACPPPASYCAGAPNSVGPGARMGSNGATSVAADAFELSATGAPPLQPAFFLYGAQEAAAPMGAGLRCVAPPLFRLRPLVTSGQGEAAYPLRLDQLPPGGAIVAGSEWRFQLWYRDVGAGGPEWNASDGLAVTFCP